VGHVSPITVITSRCEPAVLSRHSVISGCSDCGLPGDEMVGTPLLVTHDLVHDQRDFADRLSLEGNALDSGSRSSFFASSVYGAISPVKSRWSCTSSLLRTSGGT
jgi:hypothetical protein